MLLGALLEGESGALYRGQMRQLLVYKARSRMLMDTSEFLRHVRCFSRYRCHRALAPRVYPDGRFIFPCPNLCRRDINVLRACSWSRLMEIVGQCDGTCDMQCFLPCYLETSLLVRHPFSILREL